MKKLSILLLGTLLFGEYFYSNGKQIDLKLNSVSRSGIKYYSLNNGIILGVNNYILVKFNKDVNVSKYENNYNIKKIKTIKNRFYLFKTPLNKSLEISNTLYNLDDVIFAHPDFIHKIERR